MLNITTILIMVGLMSNPTISMSEIEPTILEFEFNEQEAHRQAVYEILENYALDVANSHVYELHKFDCTDFSKELKGKLIEDGFNAYCMFGKLPNTEGYKLHTWIEVNYLDNLIEIESTRGFIVSEEQFNEDYRIYNRGGRCL